MYGTLDPDTGQPYARWNIRYASNRAAICYSDDSAHAADLTEDNWYEVVSRPGTRLGLSDPRFDALGYRQLMILQLAEAHYGQPRLFEDLLIGRFAQPIRAIVEGDQVVIHVPEILQPMPRSTIRMRGSSIQLIPLLESGDVDYIFEYESVARQHGLQTIALPPEISLGDEALAEDYAKVAVELDFQRFAVVTPAFQGEPIAYALTIPTNAPHPEEAAAFIAFLLGPEGQAIMAANHHPILSPARVDHPDQLPEMLQPLCVPD
jgi:molybdate/tungstate transport system substrate-binding protein